MSERTKRMKRCCFTGHRPEKLIGTEVDIKEALSHEIGKAIAEGKSTFISGMAKGVDIWAAELVLRYRADDPSIYLICALPFPDFGKSMGRRWGYRYDAVIAQADLVKSVCPSFSMDSYQKRNVWMVDHSMKLIAVFNGERGGTENTINYAKDQGIEITLIDPRRNSNHKDACP